MRSQEIAEEAPSGSEGSDDEAVTDATQLDEQEERRLIALAVAGDVGAFEQLLRASYPAVLAVTMGICANRSDAEDAAQDTFVRAWRAIGTFRGDSKLSTWLYRIATNTSLTLVSRRRDVPTDTLPEQPSTAGSPERRLDGQQRLAVVREALAGLTPDARATFVLRDVEGASYAEIAEALDTTVSAVKSRLFRARSVVAQAMAAYEHDGDPARSSGGGRP